MDTTKLLRWSWVLIVLLAILPFAQTLTYLPVLDDGWAVFNNPLVQGGLRNTIRIFNSPYNYGGPETTSGLFRPVTTLSYAINYAIHDSSTIGYHLVNLLLHTAVSLLVFCMTRLLANSVMPGRASWVALVAAIIFSVHPAHVEAIAPIVGRKELLSTAFALSALLVVFSGHGSGPGMPRILCAIALLALGILSNEGVAITPVLYGIIAVAMPGAVGIGNRPGLSNTVGRHALFRIVLVSTALSLAIIPYLLLNGLPRGVPPEAQWFVEESRSTVTLTTSLILSEYLRILAFPGFLGTDFAYVARVPLVHEPGVKFFLATAIWLSVFLGALYWLRRFPLPSAGILWTLAALLPVLHIIPIGVFMAERLSYLPSVGFCMALAALIVSIRRLPVVFFTTLLLVSVLGVHASARTKDWRSPRALWESELPKAPSDISVNTNMAVAYFSTEEYGKAIPLLEKAINISPTYWRAHLNLGVAKQELGMHEEARDAYRSAYNIAPSQSSPLFYYARLQTKTGNFQGAIDTLKVARRLAPEKARIATALAENLAVIGKVSEARLAYQSALTINPSDVKARVGLAALHHQQSKINGMD